MKHTVYLTCGLVRSGKSTWAKHIIDTEENYVIVCRDDIRTMLKGSYIYDYNIEELVSTVAASAILKGLQEDFNIIIDETNIKKSKRSFWLNIIEQSEVPDVDSIIMFFPEVENNLENRMKNSRGYTKEKWKDVIETMKQHFEYPSIYEDKRIHSVKEVTLKNSNYKYKDIVI